MKILFTQSEYAKAKNTTLLPVECDYCHNKGYEAKREIKRKLDGKRAATFYCSKDCQNASQFNHVVQPCAHCGAPVTRVMNQLLQSKSGNIFCNQSCAASYNNTHKTTGTRRSKLETWIEEKLITLYPNLNILFNDKSAINSELDIYIPLLNVAFEINGIFHYEPIFGVDKLAQIQANDEFKMKACYDAKIDLCTIDASALKYFKPQKAQKYLDIIIQIIKERKT